MFRKRRIKRGISLKGEEGVALLMVLVVITILTAMVVSFTDTTQKHLQVTQYYKDRLQATMTAQSGYEIAAKLLSYANLNIPAGLTGLPSGAPSNNSDSVNSPWHYDSIIYETSVLPILMMPVCGSNFFEPALPIEEGDSTKMALVFDENSRLSLFKLFPANYGTANEETDRPTFESLSALLVLLLDENDLLPANQQATTSLAPTTPIPIQPDQADRLVGYLVDWIDTENNKADQPYNTDQAEDYCPEDNLPYVSKNGRMDSIDEIGQVCGFRQIARPVVERLTRYLTIYNLDTNINTASRTLLQAIFEAAGTSNPEEDADRIYSILHGNKETDEPAAPAEIAVNTWLGQQGINTSGNNWITMVTKSTHFRIGVYGVVYDTETMAERARSKLMAVLNISAAGGGAPAAGANIKVLYYRED